MKQKGTFQIILLITHFYGIASHSSTRMLTHAANQPNDWQHLCVQTAYS